MHPLSLSQVQILSMSIGSALEHIYWILCISQEYMIAGGAVGISIFNTINNSLTTLL